MKAVVQAFFTSRQRAVGCYGITDDLTRHLQSIQKAAVGDRHSAMRPHLASFPPAALASSVAACQVQGLVYHALSGHTPGYLADACYLITDARPKRLRSAETRTLLISWTRINFGDRAFCAAGPRV